MTGETQESAVADVRKSVLVKEVEGKGKHKRRDKVRLSGYQDPGSSREYAEAQISGCCHNSSRYTRVGKRVARAHEEHIRV